VILDAGQSAAGNFVQLFARTYPGEVVGVAMNPVPRAEPWLANALPLMTKAERADEEAYYRGELNEEAFAWIASSDQLVAAPSPPDVPCRSYCCPPSPSATVPTTRVGGRTACTRR